MSFFQSSKEAVIITFSFHLLLKETGPSRYFLLSFYVTAVFNGVIFT